MCEHDRRRDVAHHSGDACEGFAVVENREVVEQRRVRNGPGQTGGLSGFRRAQADDFPARIARRAAVAVGKIPHVNLRPCVPQAEQGARHHEFNIVGMRGGRQYDTSCSRLFRPVHLPLLGLAPRSARPGRTPGESSMAPGSGSMPERSGNEKSSDGNVSLEMSPFSTH